ncbi:transducin beta-like protein 2 [Ischnura elegans]|uniref:transducin beta-like protein 2 n=1 Tax=Ischnura elegans TaxID=197161 RepID=UPI001ED8A488|nr:transducin beta-like protein 2 [Ischnura elegans]
MREDRSLHLWTTKDFSQKERKSVRVNVEFDHASKVRWSPDCKAFLILRATDNTLEVYKVHRKPEGGISSVEKGITFPKHHTEDVIGLDIACTGRYIMTCSEKTDLVIWDLKGQNVLGKVDTYLMSTTCARISPCGRFVAASGFTPDLKVWEVSFAKSGEFKQLARAFELKGHTSGIHDFGFNCDSSRMSSVSKDGTWRLYDTKIEFEKGEDPHLLMTGKYKPTPDVASRLALSPDGTVVAVASGTSLHLYSSRTGNCEASIHDIHAAPINCVLFDAAGKYVLTTGDKHVHVFHNVIGQKELLASARMNLRSAGTSAMRERLEAQIASSEAFLQKMGVTGA